jgi:hypothetical protein
MSFEFDKPYCHDIIEPAIIRDDALELAELVGYEEMYKKLALYISTDKMQFFIDDVVMGRV